MPFTPQTHHIGAPILPELLAGMPYAERRKHVMRAINALGVPEAAADTQRQLPSGAPADVVRTLVGSMERWGSFDAEWLARWRG